LLLLFIDIHTFRLYLESASDFIQNGEFGFSKYKLWFFSKISCQKSRFWILLSLIFVPKIVMNSNVIQPWDKSYVILLNNRTVLVLLAHRKRDEYLLWYLEVLGAETFPTRTLKKRWNSVTKSFFAFLFVAHTLRKEWLCSWKHCSKPNNFYIQPLFLCYSCSQENVKLSPHP
jgi:hypothetical protein